MKKKNILIFSSIILITLLVLLIIMMFIGKEKLTVSNKVLDNNYVSINYLITKKSTRNLLLLNISLKT